VARRRHDRLLPPKRSISRPSCRFHCQSMRHWAHDGSLLRACAGCAGMGWPSFRWRGRTGETRRNSRTPPTSRRDSRRARAFTGNTMVQLACFSNISHHRGRLLEVRAGTRRRSQGWGYVKGRATIRWRRESEQSVSLVHRVRRSSPCLRRFPVPYFSSMTPGSLCIVYANASAQALTGATPEELCGNLFWRCAPHLVSTSRYQAIQKTREPTDMAYVSPITTNWLHVSLSPTIGGLMLQFHEVREPTRCQEMFP
jgi:PAS domain-containing protein